VNLLTYVMSDDTLFGFLDTDGGILLNLEYYERNNKPVAKGNQPLGIQWLRKKNKKS